MDNRDDRQPIRPDNAREVRLLRSRRERRRRQKRKRIITAVAIIVFAALAVTLILLIPNKGQQDNKTELIVSTEAPAVSVTEQIPTESPTEVPTPEPTPQPLSRRGTATAIPDSVRQTMEGKSMHKNPNISYDDLSYLTIPHYDFNYNTVEGHMVVNKAVAEEVLNIFAELYDIKYPIERMELVDKYGADDFTSIEYNNTSAFNYRESTDGSGRLSRHALGRAIDINPQINPYVNGSGTGSHQNAKEYWSRNRANWTSEIAKAAYIGPEAEIYKIFVNKYGWEWGGSWSGYRDYQHFQKTR